MSLSEYRNLSNETDPLFGRSNLASDFDDSGGKLQQAVYSDLFSRQQEHCSIRSLQLAQAPQGEKITTADEASKAEKTHITRKQLEEWVKQLGDDNFFERENAQQNLLGVEFDALPILKDAVKNPNLEISDRARSIVNKLYKQTLDWTSIHDAVKNLDESDSNTIDLNMSELTELIKIINLTKINPEEAKKIAQGSAELSEIYNSYSDQDSYIEAIQGTYKDATARLNQLKSDYGNIEQSKKYVEDYVKGINSLDLAFDNINEQNSKAYCDAIKSCSNLKELTITTAPLVNIPKKELESLCGLPNLEVLTLACATIKQLPSKLPEHLHVLDLGGCSGLEQLPDNLPADILSIQLRGCENLKKLPAILPSKLITLDLDRCTKLTELPSLENLNQLAMLKLYGCANLNLTNLDIQKLRKKIQLVVAPK